MARSRGHAARARDTENSNSRATPNPNGSAAAESLPAPSGAPQQPAVEGSVPDTLDLNALKQKIARELADIARDLGVESAASMRKQELIFAILQAQAEKAGQV